MRFPAPIYGFALLLAGSLCLPAASAQQKKNVPPPGSQPIPGTPFTPQNTNCSGQVKWGDHGRPEASSNCPPAPHDSKTPPLTASPAPAKPSTAEDNPFPEAVSSKAAEKANAEKSAPPPDADASSSRERLNGLDLLGNGDRAVSNGAGGFVHDPKLALQDIRVGEFYMNTGDYKGSYLRFKEATEVDPENAEAVYDLADAARKLDKKHEAIENYQIYLAALPKGPKAKAARKALSELAPGSKR